MIVTCANQMSRPIPEHLQLGQVAGGTQAERARRWIARLAEPEGAPLVPAVELYAGEHWSVARQFPLMSLQGEQVRLWVCSAGYGLIPAEAPVVPHHATLTPGQADSVPRPFASWWSILGEWDGPVPGHPRSIRRLVAADPGGAFMLVLSKNYLRACGEDIAVASGYLASPDQLFIVSAGGSHDGDLAAFAAPADARLQARFGGTRRALNARIGAHLLERGIRSRREACEYLAALLSAQPPIPRYGRKRQTDREVLDAIAARLAAAPSTSANRMLRQFRDNGLACEQRRFTRLYRQATAAPLPRAPVEPARPCARSGPFPRH